MTPSNLLKTFVNEYPITYDEMKSSEHGINSYDLNPYHMEGDVWTHTMMVYNEMIKFCNSGQLNGLDTLDLLTMALIHDMGKPLMRSEFERNGKPMVRFKGHEYLSALQGLRFALNYATNPISVLEAVTLHTTPFKNDIHDYVAKNEYLFKLLDIMTRCDDAGRIVQDGVDDNKRNSDNHVGVYYDSSYVDSIGANDQVLTIMIGPVGAGKSTIASEYGKVFAPDDKLMELAKGKPGVVDYNSAFTKMQNSDIDWVKEAKNDLFNYAYESGENVCYDATNMTHKKRNSMVNRAWHSGMKVRIVMVWRDFVECESCRSSGDKQVPLNVMLGQIERFTFPKVNTYNELDHRIIKE